MSTVKLVERGPPCSGPGRTARCQEPDAHARSRRRRPADRNSASSILRAHRWRRATSTGRCARGHPRGRRVAHARWLRVTIDAEVCTSPDASARHQHPAGRRATCGGRCSERRQRTAPLRRHGEADGEQPPLPGPEGARGLEKLVEHGLHTDRARAASRLRCRNLQFDAGDLVLARAAAAAPISGDAALVVTDVEQGRSPKVRRRRLHQARRWRLRQSFERNWQGSAGVPRGVYRCCSWRRRGSPPLNSVYRRGMVPARGGRRPLARFRQRRWSRCSAIGGVPGRQNRPIVPPSVAAHLSQWRIWQRSLFKDRIRALVGRPRQLNPRSRQGRRRNTAQWRRDDFPEDCRTGLLKDAERHAAADSGADFGLLFRI